MNLIEVLLLLFVAGVCGSIGQALAGSTRGGCLASIVVGFAGAMVGVWISRGMHLPELLVVTIGGATFPVVWAIIGSALFVALLSLLARPRRSNI